MYPPIYHLFTFLVSTIIGRVLFRFPIRIVVVAENPCDGATINYRRC